MLPNFETCRKHIIAYKKRIKTTGSETITFPKFWDYKIGLEQAGQNILDEKNLDTTASLLSGLQAYLKIRNSGVADISRLKAILRNIQPYYPDIRGISLGDGKIFRFRSQLESIYERLGGTTDAGDGDHRLSIAGRSAILMAIWGQVPRFDRLNRRRFEKWTHYPAPRDLPHLSTAKIWYRPDEFCDIVEALDHWVLAWPNFNYGKYFEKGFIDLCPGIPPGRQIDIVYHWKLPDTWVDYRLQTQGSGIAISADTSIDEYCVE